MNETGSLPGSNIKRRAPLPGFITGPLYSLYAAATIYGGFVLGGGSLPNISSERNEKHQKIHVTSGGKMDIGFGKIKPPEGTGVKLDAIDLDPFMQDTSLELPPRCGDGRPVVPEQSSNFGVAIFGGSVADTASLIMCGKCENEDQGMAFIFRTGKLGVGGHTDTESLEHHFTHGTGCGANDKQIDILKNIGTHRAALIPFAQLLIEKLGLAFESDVYQRVVDGIPENVEHDPVSITRNYFRDRALQVLKSGHEGVHGHIERTIVINLVRRKTFNGTKFYTIHGDESFSFDLWALPEHAKILAEGDPTLEKELLYSLVLYQLGTAITPTNGQQEIFFLESAE